HAPRSIIRGIRRSHRPLKPRHPRRILSLHSYLHSHSTSPRAPHRVLHNLSTHHKIRKTRPRIIHHLKRRVPRHALRCGLHCLRRYSPGRVQRKPLSLRWRLLLLYRRG
ncbi:hypothetical protein VIGAN_03168200, partial [Vigna angularis var. angularis]